jgi:hypothetical protein
MGPETKWRPGQISSSQVFENANSSESSSTTGYPCRTLGTVLIHMCYVFNLLQLPAATLSHK